MDEHWQGRTIAAILWHTKAGDTGASRAGQCRFCWHQGVPLPWLLRVLMAIELLTPTQEQVAGEAGSNPKPLGCPWIAAEQCSSQARMMAIGRVF